MKYFRINIIFIRVFFIVMWNFHRLFISGSTFFNNVSQWLRIDGLLHMAIFRARLKVLLVLCLVGGLIWAAVPISASAKMRASPVLIVVVDTEAVRESVSGVGLIESFIGLLATVKEDQRIVFIASNMSSTVIGPFDGNDPELEWYLDDIRETLRSPVKTGSDALAYALAESQNMLADNRINSLGSTVYLISGDSDAANFAHMEGRLGPIANRFREKGWPINGVGLPGASEQATQFLKNMSVMSGGRLHDLSVSSGLSRLANTLLSEDAKSSLKEVAVGRVTKEDLLTSVVSIPPGTSQSTLLFFRESPYGSLILTNPVGLEFEFGDSSISQALETPHMVTWKLENPVPGNWTVDARGMSGELSAWELSPNKYNVVLKSVEPVPLGEATSIIAYVMDGGQPTILESAFLRAIVTTPKGIKLTFDMNDDGIYGDAAPHDGYFSMTLPPLDVEGHYDIELELSWRDFDHRSMSQFSFEAISFPSIEIQTNQIENFELGTPTKLGKIFVHLRGQPYPISPHLMHAGLTSTDGLQSVVELLPLRLFGSGPAWEYDVVFTPESSGLHTLVFRLTLDYAGRSYVHASDPIVLSPSSLSALSLTQSGPIVKSIDVVERVEPKPVVQQHQLSQLEPMSTQSQFSQVLITGSVVLVLSIGLAFLYLYTRTRPYGYIYRQLNNNQNEVLVDFSKVDRNSIVDFLFRSTVRGKDLGIKGLDGVVFHFKGDRVDLSSQQNTPTVRINNHPLVRRTSIEHNTWIGTGGNLYSFLRRRPT